MGTYEKGPAMWDDDILDDYDWDLDLEIDPDAEDSDEKYERALKTLYMHGSRGL